MSFILDLLIFILSLGVLIIIHELGHFLTAKAFGVYCREFSIGMGPLLFKIKRKNGETQFSIRAIPIGGFVSMVGEDAGTVEGLGGQKEIKPEAPQQEIIFEDEKQDLNLEVAQQEITANDVQKVEELSEEEKLILSLPDSRKLNGIKRWKRAIIMAAGVTMNLILGFFLFIGQGATSLTYDDSYRSLVIQNTSGLMAQNGYIDGSDFISGNRIIYYTNRNGELKSQELVDDDIKNSTELSRFFTIDADYLPTGIDNYVEYHFVCKNPTTEENYNIDFVRKAVLVEGEDNQYTYEGDMGVAFHGRNRSFGEVMAFSWNSCVDASQVIFKGLGMIFTDGLNALGGPIAMFEISSQANSLGISYYFYLWGLISINLAIMNFLPIPGLDGWHFLVLIFEGITKKQMPEKAKNIASMIGLALLFGLMIAVTIKDIIGLF